MIHHYHINDNLNKARGIDDDFNQFIISHFDKPINIDKIES